MTALWTLQGDRKTEAKEHVEKRYGERNVDSGI